MSHTYTFVRIKTAGCDIYPHQSVHKVQQLDIANGVYPILDGSDRINKDWCEEIDVLDYMLNHQKTFGNDSINGVDLNTFRRLGYNADGTRTGKFTDAEYSNYESYLKYYKLEFKP